MNTMTENRMQKKKYRKVYFTWETMSNFICTEQEKKKKKTI